MIFAKSERQKKKWSFFVDEEKGGFLIELIFFFLQGVEKGKVLSFFLCDLFEPHHTSIKT